MPAPPNESLVWRECIGIFWLESLIQCTSKGFNSLKMNRTIDENIFFEPRRLKNSTFLLRIHSDERRFLHILLRLSESQPLFAQKRRSIHSSPCDCVAPYARCREHNTFTGQNSIQPLFMIRRKLQNASSLLPSRYCASIVRESGLLSHRMRPSLPLSSIQMKIRSVCDKFSEHPVLSGSKVRIDRSLCVSAEV